MSNLKITSVNEILKDINFHRENAISNDLLCLFCNEILIDAHNAPCGCRYCLGCITAYLDGEEKYCPGNTDDCKNELLNINNNILIDHPMNIKISRLIMKCPEKECGEKVEMRNLEDHIRVCKWKPTNCPFYNVGCTNVQITNDKLQQHLLSENYAHTKLLMDYIDVMRNDFGQVKEAVREIKVEKPEINAEMKGEQFLKNSLRAVIYNNLQYILIPIIVAVILLIAVFGFAIFSGTWQSRHIHLLREELAVLSNVNREMKDNIKVLHKKIKSFELQIHGGTEMNENSEKIEAQGINASVEIKGFGANMINISIQHHRENHYGQFVWSIANFTDKRKKAKNGIGTQILSESFFSHKNGYKMCLSVYPNGIGDEKGTHLSVFVHLMRGPFDDRLPWPCKYDVRIAIVNQQSGFNHINYRIKSSANTTGLTKPISERNIGNGFSNFIRLDELLGNLALFSNDTIVLKCTVADF